MTASCPYPIPATDLLSVNYPFKRIDFSNLTRLFLALLMFCGVVYGQAASAEASNDQVVLIEGTSDSTVFGMGKTIKITGTVKQGALAFGGDVIVEGTVEGDVATIGGSVIQLEGSRIGGDVIVLGGSYRHGEKPPLRTASSMTMMYAGYQQELRDIMRNPIGLLSPRWTPGYIGTRILVVLFWFVICLGVTAAMPGTISRGVARLQLTSLRVAIIGLVGVIVLCGGVPLALWFLPETLSVLVGLLALLLLVVAGLFGRVILYAATGRWLQRKYVPVGRNSEAVALLLGTVFWVTLTSLPYVWPFIVSFIVVISLGLALTARYRVGWQRAVMPSPINTPAK
jgi:hypothetical protein